MEVIRTENISESDKKFAEQINTAKGNINLRIRDGDVKGNIVGSPMALLMAAAEIVKTLVEGGKDTSAVDVHAAVDTLLELTQSAPADSE